MELPTEEAIRPIVEATLGPHPLTGQEVLAAVKKWMNVELSNDDIDRLWVHTKINLLTLATEGKAEVMDAPKAGAAGVDVADAGPLEVWFRRSPWA